jgi:hypothetical protein
MQHEHAEQHMVANPSSASFRQSDNLQLNSQAQKIVSNVRAYEFEDEINQLSL